MLNESDTCHLAKKLEDSEGAWRANSTGSFAQTIKRRTDS
jgi:hypothetical protein